MTPFQQHKQRVQKELAEQQQKQKLAAGDLTTAAATANDYSAFEVLKNNLDGDLKTLSGLVQGDEKQAKKKSLVEFYMGHVSEYLNQAEVYANAVLVNVILWLFDLGRIAEALPMAKVAIEQQQSSPAGFSRNLPTVVADLVLEWCDKQHSQGHSVEPVFSEVLALLHGWPVPDVVKMKYHKFAGNQAFSEGDMPTAVSQYEQAISFESASHKAQVKTKLEKARAALSGSTTAHEQEDETD